METTSLTGQEPLEPYGSQESVSFVILKMATSTSSGYSLAHYVNFTVLAQVATGQTGHNLTLKLVSPSEREILAFHPDLLNTLVTSYLRKIGRLQENQTAIVDNVAPGPRVTIIEINVETTNVH